MSEHTGMFNTIEISGDVMSELLAWKAVRDRSIDIFGYRDKAIGGDL